MGKLKRLFAHSEYHVLLFCLFFFLVTWPFLSIFQDKPPHVLFIYFFVVWIGAIVFLLFTTKKYNEASSVENARSERGTDD